MNELMRRQRALMMAQGGDVLIPVTALVSSTSPIDTGITINNNVVMTIRAKRDTGENNSGWMFSDGITRLKKANSNFSNYSKAFNETYEPYVKSTTVKNFVIDGVNHYADWSTSSGQTFTATQFVQASQTMRLAVYGYDNSEGYTYYYVKATESGVLAHDLRPYLKNGKPGFLDIITNEFHTVAEGGVDWTYIQ